MYNDRTIFLHLIAMKPLQKYIDLPDYLLRFTILHIGPLHIRIHTILTPDGTPYLHNHPFHYLSIILQGGYTEQLLINKEIKTYRHGPFSFIVRRNSDFHRIHSLAGKTKTLFFAFNTKGSWSLKKSDSISEPDNFQTPQQYGIYSRTINGSRVYAKFDEFWYKSSPTTKGAENETMLSIHQTGDFEGPLSPLPQ